MRKALQTGIIKPIISRRIMIQGATKERKIKACERYGKVLVNLQEETKFSNCIPQLFFHSDKCYLVIDGFNIFGKVLIEWMIEQGARKFIIVSNMSNQDSENLVLKWRENGATIIVRQERTKIDSSISSLKYFKVTEILDKYSRKHCPLHVKFFIFSSLDLDEDSLRDTNVEKLYKKRKESSLHGLFILLPNFVGNTLTETKFQNLYNTKMSWFLKRLNAILRADSSVIAVRQILTNNSPNDDEKNIFVGETDDEQRIDEGNPQDEKIRQFEQYLYNYDYKVM
ncbi:uncharacterized protein LOC122526688 isoform X2 [Polistes fuscatus]|uniref:uncharacterized protein LOC122526688 isoform X2 n=1 Tax=Polistes fuscatus TaxID=30207 RepID=UPI001CA92F2F|nr:uncharacterized protein LOC122526688 isoform X2 [Polistes fuscatus]